MIRIYPSTFSGTLTAPPLQSHAQRLLFAASVSTIPTTVYNVPASRDIDTTIACLQALGCTVVPQGRSALTVKPFPKTVPVPTADFDFGGSATSSRLALAVACAYGIQTNCFASESLKKRPLVPLGSRMAIRGVTFSGFSFPLSTQGRLEGGEYVFGGEDGAEYISSLLLALPLLAGPSSIRLSSPLFREGDVDITLKLLERFGIVIHKVPGGYDIPGRQVYASPGKVAADNDWSLSSLWLTAGALSQKRGGTVTCTNLPADSPQGYRNLSEMISQLVTDFKTIYVDAQDCSALAPLIAIVAAAGRGTAHISGISQLRYKETDRLKTMASILNSMGASITETKDGWIAQGKGGMSYPDDFFVDCQTDPNLAMSFALAACVLDQPFVLDETAVNKTWPDFFNLYKSLGGKFEIAENSIDI
jgi:3-phosphoshikimate 1-carboxyvinyltransferase